MCAPRVYNGEKAVCPGRGGDQLRHNKFSFLYSFLSLISPIVIGALFVALPVAASATTTGVHQPAATAAVSHVRVVRLSFLQGTAAIRRPGSDQWTEAMVNTPIQEGFVLSTDKGSFLEIEFENGSTVRMGEKSELDFTQLALAANGGHLSHMILEDGYATFTVIPKRNDEYVVTVGGVDVTPSGKTEFRTDLDQNHMRLEVLGGRVQAADSSEKETVSKNHVLVRDSGDVASFQVSDKIKKDDWDKWTDARAEQTSLAYDEEAVNLGSPIFGWDDLDVYGEWGFFPGFGNAWVPYEPAGWSPYSSGLWDFYPGLGYTWVSGEPWGWLPYHYGFWNYSPAAGWFWMPGAPGAAWSPALVNWYSGPGWVGWTPVGSAGVGGRLPCTLAVNGCLTAVSPTVLSNGQKIVPGSSLVVHPTSVETFTHIAQPEVAAVSHGVTGFRAGTATGAPAFISANRAANGAGNGATGGAAAPRAVVSASAFERFNRGSAGAPSSVIMGRKISSDAFLAGHSGDRAAVHARLGGSLGGFQGAGFQGRNGVQGAGGRVAAGGDGPRIAARGAAGGAGGGPQIFSRGSSGGSVGASGGGFARGGGAGGSGGGGAVSRGGGSAPAGGGSSGSVAHH
jgi:hypothetical protein